MRVVLISPPGERANEIATVESLFAAGLERYHLRKPGWKRARVALWLAALSARWRDRVALHSHADLAPSFRVWGIHFRDDRAVPEEPAARVPPGCLASRSCHDVVAVKAALGRYDAILFSPVFRSLSKPGYGPAPRNVKADLCALLAARSPAEKTTKVFALGGVTAQRVPDCRALGFDGVAILGAVWMAADPVAAFLQFQDVVRQPDVTQDDREPSP